MIGCHFLFICMALPPRLFAAAIEETMAEVDAGRSNRVILYPRVSHWSCFAILRKGDKGVVPKEMGSLSVIFVWFKKICVVDFQ